MTMTRKLVRLPQAAKPGMKKASVQRQRLGTQAEALSNRRRMLGNKKGKKRWHTHAEVMAGVDRILRQRETES